MYRIARRSGILCGLLAATAAAAAPTFEQQVQPFVENHCALCHNSQLKTAGVVLDAYPDGASAAADAPLWLRVKKMLGQGLMPPQGQPRPPREGVLAVLAWIDGNTVEPDRSKLDPGRVTARRLNRAEYNNTVRDLLAIEFRPADDFPVDDTGYGFDNIGDVLSISPVLMEKYMAAAEKISRRAILTDRSVQPTVVRYSAPRGPGETAQIGSAAKIPYSPEGRLRVRARFPATGDYELRLRYSDRRRLPPRRPAWNARVPELIEKLSAVDAETIDMALLGKRLGVRRQDAFRFLRRFGAVKKGGSWMVERAHLIAKLHEYEQWLKENPEPPPPPPPPALPVVFGFDGETLATYLADRDPKTRGPSTIAKRIEAGEHLIHAEILNADGERWNPNSRDWNEYRVATTAPAKRMIFVDSVEIRGPYNAEPAPLPASHRRIMTCDPEGKNFDAACAEKILGPLLRFAFRRPVEDEILARYVAFARMAVEDSESFARGIQLALKAILVSPRFLFRIERDPDPTDPAAVHPIGDYELASRLSYFLWSSMPDDELLGAAGRGELRTAEGRESQVRRMIRDEKSRALVENFVGQWLELRNLAIAKPDPETFPEFDDELRAAMIRETELFFGAIVREERSILEFINADYTYLNERLAKHYGIEGVEGPGFRKVKLSGEQRGGVLTQASVLTVSSYPTRTSPVLRGRWVLDNLLGEPPPDPPANVPPLNEQAVGSAASLREELERHRADPTCAVCHDKMDPLGFGLENYNAIGAWRTMDGKFPIDSSGVLPGGERFSGPAELKEILYNEGDRFVRNLTAKMLTYALGRGLESYDDPAVEKIQEKLRRNRFRFSSLVLGVVESAPFQMRRGEGGD